VCGHGESWDKDELLGRSVCYARAKSGSLVTDVCVFELPEGTNAMRSPETMDMDAYG
jgi:hypothetical protein